MGAEMPADYYGKEKSASTTMMISGAVVIGAGFWFSKHRWAWLPWLVGAILVYMGYSRWMNAAKATGH